ncbi:3873_t:CDS:2 [Diversispora eburnea]|uniref:3873_t:CDS:1 n=1 Tax=Diversispora eburnea TaxID=1213867 RepID=A0A9N8VS03_9GLOM|nr:3873_t:CDS:2 [Diversispora eburnea]
MPNKPLHMLREVWSKFTQKKTPTRLNVRKKKWVHPKDRIERWKILEGDTVKVIAGDDKFKIGKVKEIDKFTNRVWITPSLELPLNKGVQPNKEKSGGWWLRPSLKAIHVSNLMHIHPDDLKEDSIPDKEKRRVRVNWRKLDIDGNGKMRWRRVICGTNEEIPFPPKPKEPWEDQEKSVFDTDKEVASRLTWKISNKSPLPRGVVNELRNKFKPWRYSARLKNRPFI